MPEYVFKDKAGKEYLEYFAMGEAPAIGAKIRRKGKVLTRVITLLQIANPRSWEFLAWSLPEGHKDAPHHVEIPVPGCEPAKACAFKSKQEVREFEAKFNGMAKDHYGQICTNYGISGK